MTDRLAWLLAQQAPTGAFPSRVNLGDGEKDDWNGFVTALVARSLARLPAPDEPAVSEARQRALDFLMRCESTELSGAFSFWPEEARPSLVGELPPDTDDTAIIALELARAGRWRQRDLVQLAVRILIPARLRRRPPNGPPWLRRGVFPTWLGPRAVRRRGANPVDCAVNANIAALLAWANLCHLPGYAESCAMILDALDWAGSSPARLRALTPFYADPGELALALDHAVECGAAELTLAARRVRSVVSDLRPNRSPGAREAFPVCCSAYGQVVWFSPALQVARQLGYRLPEGVGKKAVA